MSFKKLLEDATSHFLRSQFAECLAKLQDIREITSAKKSVVLQSVVMNNCELCVQQLGDIHCDPGCKSFEEILQLLQGLPPSKHQSLVKSIVHYNSIISLLHKSPSIQLQTKATAASVSIEKHLSEALQCLDESSLPIILLRCALSLSGQVAGLAVSDWTITPDGGRNSQEAWYVAMATASGCRVLSHLENELDVHEEPSYEVMSPEAIQALLKCHRACQMGSWHQALEIIKHNKRLWRGTMKDEMTYVKNICLFKLSSFEEAKQSQQKFLTRSSLSPSLKVKGHQLLGCCCARQGKCQLAITEFKKALACTSPESHLLCLHNLSLLFQKLNETDTEVEILSHLMEVSSESIPSLEEPRLIFSPRCNLFQPTTDLQVKAMYTYASRCLHLERFEEAAEVYLDLISLLEESSVCRLGHSTLLPINTPRVPQVYLEASFALFSIGKFEEAESICDAVISRLGSLTALQRIVRDSDQSPEAESGTDGCMDNEGQEVAKLSEELSRGEISCQRTTSRGVNGLQEDVFHLASLHFMKSQCLMKMEKPSMSLECLDQALEVLQGYSSEEMGKETEAASSSSPVAKRRKLDSGHKQRPACSDQMKENVRLLKGRAYNNKSLILIGQGKLHEALPVLLSSLECCPENVDAQKNYYLLLFKLGRKKQAYAEWRKIKKNSP